MNGTVMAEVREHAPEGSTVIFEAPQRRGKSLGAVIWAWDAYEHGRNVFSTIQLGIPHEQLTFADIDLEQGSKRYWNGHIFIDELNFFFDCRRSMSSANIRFGNYLLQQKKQGCNLTGTTHSLEYLDRRIRDNHDFVVTPRVYPAFPKPPETLKLHIRNGPTMPPFEKKITVDCRPFLGLYDSYAVYDVMAGFQKTKARGVPPPESRGSLFDD